MEERQGETDKKSTFAKKIQKGLTMVDSNNEIVVSHTSDFIREIKHIIDAGRTTAYAAVNAAMITTY